MPETYTTKHTAQHRGPHLLREREALREAERERERLLRLLRERLRLRLSLDADRPLLNHIREG